MLDGTDDLAKYPAAQRLVPSAALGNDAAAITWDRDRLYVSVTSDAFLGPIEPLHIYLEAAVALGSAVATKGKEYTNKTAELPFKATHLLAVRRVSDGYNGVYRPAGAWARDFQFIPGNDMFVSSNMRTLSVKVPWTALGGCPLKLRLALHVFHGVEGNEWKDLVPSTHTPWQAPGGGYYEIDLTGAQAVADWTLR